MRLTTSRSGAGNPILGTRGISPALAWTIVLGALLVTFELDRLTAAAPVQHLYYLPIFVAGIASGRRGALLVAFTAIALYHLANPFLLTFRYEESDLVQMTLFVAVGLVTAKQAENGRKLSALAMTDDLTGLHNLRSFEARLTTMMRESRLARTPLSLLVLDVDRLKSLNDTYGHLAGAEAVRAVGHMLAARLPADVVACRYGGDEFAIAIPRRTASEARAVADDLRMTINAMAPLLAGRSFPETTLSVSIGLACRSGDANVPARASASDEEAGEALFRAADRALYVAKEGGRNRVSLHVS